MRENRASILKFNAGDAEGFEITYPDCAVRGFGDTQQGGAPQAVLRAISFPGAVPKTRQSIAGGYPYPASAVEEHLVEIFITVGLWQVHAFKLHLGLPIFDHIAAKKTACGADP